MFAIAGQHHHQHRIANAKMTDHHEDRADRNGHRFSNTSTVLRCNSTEKIHYACNKTEQKPQPCIYPLGINDPEMLNAMFFANRSISNLETES
jgi:hypothetical protein